MSRINTYTIYTINYFLNSLWEIIYKNEKEMELLIIVVYLIIHMSMDSLFHIQQVFPAASTSIYIYN